MPLENLGKTASGNVHMDFDMGLFNVSKNLSTGYTSVRYHKGVGSLEFFGEQIAAHCGPHIPLCHLK